jgi:hypothetical protein
MSSDRTLRLYIVGSEVSGASEAARNYFALSCNALGEFIATQDIILTIGSTHAHTADYHVLKGVKNFLRQHPGRKCRVNVIVRDDDSDKDVFAVDLQEFPTEIFEVQRIPITARGNHARLISGLRHSDVTLLIAGGSGTYTTGIAALSMKHPTLEPIREVAIHVE